MRVFVYFLPLLQFFTVMRDRSIASLTIGDGSVQITTDHYQLVEDDPKGLYHYLYVHSVEHGGFSLLVYYLSADKQECYFFREVNGYPTLADCQKANIPLDPQKEEFETWYAPAAFKTYSAYPTLADADSTKVDQVSRDFVEKFMEHAQTFRRNNLERMQKHTPVVYGGDTYQNILSKVLIAHHLNPDANMADLSRRSEQLHLNVTNMPRYHPASRRPTLSTDSTRVNAEH